MPLLHPLALSHLAVCCALLVPATGAAASEPELAAPPAPGIERPIAAGETHRYRVRARAGEYVRVAVVQRGIDLAVELTDPAGEPVTMVDDPGGREVTERLAWLAATAGSYGLDVVPRAGESGEGTYRISIEEQRPADAAARERLAAETAEARADRSFVLRTAEALEEADGLYQKALSYWEGIGGGGTAKSAELLYRLGVVAKLRGAPEEALDRLERARDAHAEAGDRGGEATAWNQRGLVHLGRSETDAAEAAFRAALELWRELDRPDRSGPVLNNLGLVHHARGELREAIARFEEAREAFSLRGDGFREAAALYNVAALTGELGEPVEALALHERALEAARAAENRQVEADALNGSGRLHEALGEPRDARQAYLAALDLATAMGDRARRAATLQNLGVLATRADDPEQAIGFHQRALELQRASGYRRGEGITLVNLGQALSLAGRAVEAEESFAEALEVLRAVGDQASEAMALASLSDHRLRQGAAEAVSGLERALALRTALGDRPGAARTRHRLGLARLEGGQSPAAREALEMALGEARMLPDPLLEAVVLQALARLELLDGRPAAGLDHARAAVALVESVRGQGTGDLFHTAFAGSLADAYEVEVEMLLALHRADPGAGYGAEAFVASERARARGLLDLLRTARVAPAREVDPELLDRERRLRQTVSAKAELRQRLLGRAGSAAATRVEELGRKIALLLARYAALEEEIRAASPWYAGLSRPEPLTIESLRREYLDGETALFEIDLGSAASVSWWITTDGVEIVELPGRVEIAAVTRGAWEALSTRDPGRTTERRRALDELGRLLLVHVGDRLDDRSRLVVVADGVLQSIPFAALPHPTTGEPLVRSHEIVHLPSASVLAELRRSRERTEASAGAVAIFADPVFSAADPRVELPAGRPAPGAAPFERLVWTRREAEAITARVAPERVALALGFDASRETLAAAEAGRHRILHFATHGLLDDRNPALSGLVLSLVAPDGAPREGYLHLPELFDLELASELVVLSGCHTAQGKEIRGAGLVGLTHGFFEAGARQLVASLWAVSDRATAELMDRFYEGIFTEDLTPAAALRRAQLSLLATPRWRDPAFWAPFVLQGDWTGRP